VYDNVYPYFVTRRLLCSIFSIRLEPKNLLNTQGVAVCRQIVLSHSVHLRLPSGTLFFFVIFMCSHNINYYHRDIPEAAVSLPVPVTPDLPVRSCSHVLK
jgi:hypothetical protein